MICKLCKYEHSPLVQCPRGLTVEVCIQFLRREGYEVRKRRAEYMREYMRRYRAKDR